MSGTTVCAAQMAESSGTDSGTDSNAAMSGRYMYYFPRGAVANQSADLIYFWC